MKRPFIVYLKNKTSLEFEYKNDVSIIVRTGNGYRITFNNGKSYNYGADKVQYYPFVSTRVDVRIYENGKLNKAYNTVDNYGRYLIYRNGNNCSAPIENNPNIEICKIKKDTHQAESIIDYFKEILEKSGGVSFDLPSEETEGRNPNQVSANILLRALENIDLLESRTALSNYIDGNNPAMSISLETLIYPFGCNESQKLAVETSLSNSISIVEGPPGTGKTQTILNIIANLIVQNKTPVLAIEVDGVSFHDNDVQQERDKKKNHILEVLGLPLLRLSTDGYNEETRIMESLNLAMRKP